MSAEKIDQLFGYVESRCLWQFGSRTWDRQESINGIIEAATGLLLSETPKLDTAMDRLFYAESKTMVADFKDQFAWINGAGPAEIRDLMQGLKERVVDVAITRSQNHELNHSLY